MNEQLGTELQRVEASITEAEEYLEFSKHEDILTKNESFKKVIMEGYFKDEAARLAGMLADPSMADDINQRELNSALKGIGHLRQYLMNIRRTHNSIIAGLQDSKDLADEMREEEA